jgi:hypothetical protein
MVKVPSNWFYFFTSMLLSLDTFGWASEFLSSSAAAQISCNQGNSNVLGNIIFSIPLECPVSMKPCCLNNNDAQTPGNVDKGGNKELVIQEAEETAAPFKKRRASRKLTPMVET